MGLVKSKGCHYIVTEDLIVVSERTRQYKDNVK